MRPSHIEREDGRQDNDHGDDHPRRGHSGDRNADVYDYDDHAYTETDDELQQNCYISP